MAPARRRAGRAARAARPIVSAWPFVAMAVWGIAGLAGLARCAEPAQAGLRSVTDPARVIALAPAPRPGYLVPVRLSPFGARLVRITGDTGTAVGPGLGTWGSDARQVYAKQQPWNSTGTLLSIENRGGSATRSPLLLDGSTYVPRYGPCAGYDHFDFRWHPSPEHANEQIAVNRAGTELMWFDVVNCRKTRSWTLPFAAHYGIGSGEGNVSADGRFVVISDDSRMVVVDMDPRAPNAPGYPFRRIGPVYTFEPCSLQTGDPTFCPVGNISISPSGRYIDVKFGSGGASCDTLCDMHRIYEVDTALVIRPHDMASTALRCGSFAGRPNGWVFPLKHADLALDPFDHDEDVLIGGRACPGSTLGRVVKVRLRDGLVTPLTDPANEAGYSHGSARAVERPGWFYVTYARGNPRARFNGEIVAVKLDGSGAVERMGQYHSSAGTYRAQGHAVPSPDGRRVLFASDWAEGCDGGCGGPGIVGAFVIDARDSLDAGPSAGGRGARRR